MAIVACFNTPLVETTTTEMPSTSGTTGRSTETGTPATTTTVFAPTTTTMNYCTEEQGMNQPLSIQPNQVRSNPAPEETTPPGDINPTSTTPGLKFPSMIPQINVTLDQPAALTLIYLPVDRPNEPSNVNEFRVLFVYPNGTTSQEFASQIPSTSETTTVTTPSGIPSETSTTPSTSLVFPPSDVSPQVDLPPNFRVPAGTTVMIIITSTTDSLNPTGVCLTCIFCHCSLNKFLSHIISRF